jgi:hypothetical protein
MFDLNHDDLFGQPSEFTSDVRGFVWDFDELNADDVVLVDSQVFVPSADADNLSDLF